MSRKRAGSEHKSEQKRTASSSLRASVRCTEMGRMDWASAGKGHAPPSSSRSRETELCRPRPVLAFDRMLDVLVFTDSRESSKPSGRTHDDERADWILLCERGERGEPPEAPRSIEGGMGARASRALSTIPAAERLRGRTSAGPSIHLIELDRTSALPD